MTSIPPRESLARCQTPQGFRLSVIRRAYELAAADQDSFLATDDCGIVLRYLPDVPVRVIHGSERNLKITYPGDLRLAEAARWRRTLAEPRPADVTGRRPAGARRRPRRRRGRDRQIQG